MSKSMSRAQEAAEAYDKTLRAGDPRFNCTVKIIHEEGTVFFVESAFLVKWSDPKLLDTTWIFLFAEHQPTRVFLKEEVWDYAVYGPRERIEWIGEAPPEEDLS